MMARAIACNILGQTAYDCGEYTEAQAWSQQSFALEQQIGNRWSMAFSLTNLGKVAYALGESALVEVGPDRALPHLLRAVGLLDGLDLPVADALIRHRAAVVLAANDPAQRAEAVAMLRAAHRTARRLKARPLVERIAADLERLGPPLAVPGAATVLTAREAQVLRLVGDGLTSREIGRQLFLSVRTVEMHVRNGVQKLGCRTRAEAVRRLTATDPGGAG